MSIQSEVFSFLIHYSYQIVVLLTFDNKTNLTSAYIIDITNEKLIKTLNFTTTYNIESFEIIGEFLIKEVKNYKNT